MTTPSPWACSESWNTHHPFFAKPFESIEAAQEWVHEFVQWYNEEHRHSGIRSMTPSQRHQSLDKEILEKRKEGCSKLIYTPHNDLWNIRDKLLLAKVVWKKSKKSAFSWFFADFPFRSSQVPKMMKKQIFFDYLKVVLTTIGMYPWYLQVSKTSKE